jgi:hypothetical protein
VVLLFGGGFRGRPVAAERRVRRGLFGVRLRTIQKDGGALIFTVGSGYGSKSVCLGLVVRPEANTVRSRSC